MKRVSLASYIVASFILSGCGLVGGLFSTKVVEKTAIAVHFPPQVEAMKPFQLYYDFDAGCGENVDVTISLDEQAKVVGVRLSQLNSPEVCPGIYLPTRRERTVTLSSPGIYRVQTSSRSPNQATTIQVLPLGEQAPTWTPPPLNFGMR